MKRTQRARNDYCNGTSSLRDRSFGTPAHTACVEGRSDWELGSTVTRHAVCTDGVMPMSRLLRRWIQGIVPRSRSSSKRSAVLFLVGVRKFAAGIRYPTHNPYNFRFFQTEGPGGGREGEILANQRKCWQNNAYRVFVRDRSAGHSPFPYDSFIRNSMPVYPGVFPGSAWPLRLLAV